MKRILPIIALLSLAGTVRAEELIWIKEGKHAASHDLAPGKFIGVLPQ